MNHTAYTERTFSKLQSALELYGNHIFRTIGSAQTVLSYTTSEHLRPANVINL